MVGYNITVVYNINIVGYNINIVGNNINIVGYNINIVGCNINMVGYNINIVGNNIDIVGYNINIVGYNIKGFEEKLTQFADDTTLFLNGSKSSLRKAISILKTYEEASGLKINVSKTKPPTLNQVLAMLKSQFRIEKFHAERSGKLRFFRGFWAPIWSKIQILVNQCIRTIQFFQLFLPQ